jgi:hypothetical protein
MAPVGLEARYLRLLRWYPADHRAVHRDEMLGVLMAAAEPGRDRPGLGESADLLVGAARIRFRPGHALSDRNGWRDALAVYSLAGPVLMLAAAIMAWLAALVWSVLGHAAGLGLQLDVADGAYENLSAAHPVIATVIWLLLVGQAVVAVLALAGLRRCAAVAAALYVLYFGAYFVIEATFPGDYLGIEVSMPLLLVAPLTTLVALLASDGPRRGLQLMRRRHWACLAAGSVAAAFLMMRLFVWPFFTYSDRLSLIHLLDASAGAAVVLSLAAAWLSSAHGKRMAVLFGVPAFAAVLDLTAQYFDGSGGFLATRVLRPAVEALVLCVLAAIVYRTRRRAKSTIGGSGEGIA